MGAQLVMDAVKEGHKSTISSGKMVALAAGLSVGATVGYIIYRHISGPSNGKGFLSGYKTRLNSTNQKFSKNSIFCPMIRI